MTRIFARNLRDKQVMSSDGITLGVLNNFVIDVRTGTVVPQPASFNLTDSQWDQVRWAECREPDQVKM